MEHFILSCCSTADLNKKELEKRNIKWIPFHYQLNENDRLDDLGESIHLSDFYHAMEKGALTKTSQVNVTEYLHYFDEILKKGKDILHICFSSGMSGTLNYAIQATEKLRKIYPERKIFILDSLCGSSGYGLLMDEAAALRDSGMSISDLSAWVETHRLRVQHWFFSTTLRYYIRGGRVSKPAGWFGDMLKICPLLYVDEKGKLVIYEKVRTKKKVMLALADQMQRLADGGIAYQKKCFISHSDCLEDARKMKTIIEERFPNLKGKVVIHEIGTVIGSHSGPGTVAVFFWGRSRNKRF